MGRYPVYCFKEHYIHHVAFSQIIGRPMLMVNAAINTNRIVKEYV